MLQVTSVTIQGTTMGVRMFSQCYQLTSISMPNLLAIPEGAHSVSRMHDPTAPRTLCAHYWNQVAQLPMVAICCPLWQVAFKNAAHSPQSSSLTGAASEPILRPTAPHTSQNASAHAVRRYARRAMGRGSLVLAHTLCGVQPLMVCDPHHCWAA